jgi:hypothetical protein
MTAPLQSGPNCQWWTNRHLHGIYFECLSPKLAEHLNPGQHLPIATNLVGCQSCQFYEPLVFPKFEWAIGGITTQKRRPYFGETVTSMSKAGFGTGWWFSDPPAPHSDEKFRLGPFGNFYQAATRLYLMFPNATAYMICQDDIKLHPDAKKAVERIYTERMYKGKQDFPPVVSLYTAPELEKFTQVNKSHAPQVWGLIYDEWRIVYDEWRIVNEGHESPGACCYVFSAIGLRDLLTDPVVLAHKRSANGWRDIDGCVGVWATKWGGIWHHVTPLCEHIGVVSSIDRSERC